MSNCYSPGFSELTWIQLHSDNINTNVKQDQRINTSVKRTATSETGIPRELAYILPY